MLIQNRESQEMWCRSPWGRRPKRFEFLLILSFSALQFCVPVPAIAMGSRFSDDTKPNGKYAEQQVTKINAPSVNGRCGVFWEKWKFPGAASGITAMAGLAHEITAAQDCIA